MMRSWETAYDDVRMSSSTEASILCSSIVLSDKIDSDP